MDQHPEEHGNHRPDHKHAEDGADEPIEEVEAEVEERNPDPVTKREAFEREAAERGRSADARDVGQEVD